MSAADDMKLLCETLLHFDEEGLKKFKYSREDLYKMWTHSFVEAMKTNFQNIFSEEQTKKIGDMIITTLKKTEIETEDLGDGQVEIDVKGVNFGQIFNDKNWKPDINPSAGKEEMVNSLIKALEDRFNALKLSQTVILIADCVYYSDIRSWAPEDMQKFIPELFAAATGNR